MHHGTVTFQNSLFAVLAVVIVGCGAQSEPQLHPYGHGVKPLRVNCAARVGIIRPLIGTNRGPVNWPGNPQAPVFDFSENFRQFGIDSIRSHDFYGPTDWWVIFPDFTADANAPSSYEFASSDQRISAIHDAGFKCFYRLGTSWKGDNPLPINDPPGTIRNQGGQVIHQADSDDFKKFANICTNIVRHYNQGWSGGHNYGIDYWEVWNEPDMPEQFWTGTPGQYYMLYEETAKAIKALDPSLKVGGPGLSGAFTDIYMDGFVRYCRKTNAPLDFFSWHTYGGRDEYNPYCYYEYGRRVRQALNRYGYQDAESIVTEWNAGIRDEVFSDTPAGVAYYASSLMNMLDGGVPRAVAPRRGRARWSRAATSVAACRSRSPSRRRLCGARLKAIRARAGQASRGAGRLLESPRPA